MQYISAALEEAQKGLTQLRQDVETQRLIQSAAQVMVKTFQAGGRVISCGNGGSICDAMHFAEELSGRYREDRPALAAMAISDASHMSCVANDYGYEHVFSRFVEAHGRTGDVFVGFSTSGKSKNVIKAAEAAKKAGMTVVALTGRVESEISKVADIEICTPVGKYADRVQELHIKVVHILIELVERAMFPQNYK